MTFILNEDKALKSLLTGMTVSDDKNPSRPVGVWFGQPDVEIQQQAYPYITVDLVDVTEGTDRSMRGVVTSDDLDYWNAVADAPAEGQTAVAEYPIPYNLDYQITTWARHPRHDRAMLAALHSTVLMTRYKGLYIPEDNTVRSLFILGSAKRDATEQGRRLFSNVLTVRVHSEILVSTAQALQNVIRVNIATNQTDT